MATMPKMRAAFCFPGVAAYISPTISRATWPASVGERRPAPSCEPIHSGVASINPLCQSSFAHALHQASLSMRQKPGHGALRPAVQSALVLYSRHRCSGLCSGKKLRGARIRGRVGGEENTRGDLRMPPAVKAGERLTNGYYRCAQYCRSK